MELWSSAQCGEEAAATAAVAGADPNAERSRQGRSGQIRAAQGVDRHKRGQKNGTTLDRSQNDYSKRNGTAAAHGAGRSQHGPARRSKQPGQAGLDLQQHARTCSKQYGIFLARGYSSMAFPVLADSTTSALQQSPLKHPPAPTDLIPAGLESAQQPYASHRQSPSPSLSLASDRVAWDAATRALSRAATC